MERGFFQSIFASLAKAAGIMIVAFAIGTAVGLGVCLYYELPLILSLGGGFLVLGLALVLMIDSSTF